MYIRIFVFILFSYILSGFWFSCQCNGNTADTTSSVDPFGLDTSKAQPVMPLPPANKEVIIIVDEQTAKSPFKDFGCCVDEIRRKKETCCCNEVLEKYKQMRMADDKNLGVLKMSDPILAVCRKKLKKEFEGIDNPPGEESNIDF